MAISTGADSRSTANSVYSKRSMRYYTLGILTLTYSFNFIDRQLLSILQEPIKEELALSDGQLGLLTGFAFALFYVLAGLPIARMADKGNRRNIISWSIAIWSGMTAISGLAFNYWQLLAARIGVGIGEAGCSPPAHSMLSDIFPPQRRATALSIYSTGINIGILFGFLLGGWLNEFFGWRIAFMVVGLPGILIAVLMRLTVAEPRRGFSENTSPTVTADKTPPSMIYALRLLWSRKSFRHLAFGGALSAFAGYATTGWFASFMIRTHGMGTGELGSWLAGISMLGAIGTLSGGVLADYLGKHDKRWYLWVPALAAVVIGPFFAIAVMLDNPYDALIVSALPTFVTTVYVGCCIAMVHSLVGLRLRALGSAIFFLILNIIGLGLGPLSIGLVSDALEPSLGVESLRYALVTVVPVIAAWSALHFLLASRHLPEELAQSPDQAITG